MRRIHRRCRLVRLAEFAADRWDRRDVARVAMAVGTTFGIYAAQGAISDVRASPYTESARAAVRPDESPPTPSAAALEQLIESRVGLNATLLSDRIDVLTLYPNHAFVAWDAHYAHPASEFGKRIELLEELARTNDPAMFRTKVDQFPYGPIDALVLLDNDDELVFRYGADAFAAGTKPTEIRFRRELFTGFDLLPVGDHVLAIPR